MIPANVRYNLPGHQVDVNLQVFSYEIQCHSLILRLGSSYFRKFLDSADKSPAPPDATFKYQYVTIQDTPDDVPSLEARYKVEARVDRPTETGPDHWYLAVKHMIDCMYGKSFILTDILLLDSIAKVADFYGALPAVSRTLDAVLLRSPLFVESIPDDAGSLLKIAYKLRNRTLYKECMVHVAGRWKNDPCISEEDMNLRIRVIVAYASVCDTLDTTNQDLLRFIGKMHPNQPSFIQKIQPLAKNFTSLALYYRILYNEQSEYWRFEVKPLLKKVMRNSLMLDNSQCGAGEGKFRDYFLCAEVKDEELPWDQQEEDW